MSIIIGLKGDGDWIVFIKVPYSPRANETFAYYFYIKQPDVAEKVPDDIIEAFGDSKVFNLTGQLDETADYFGELVPVYSFEFVE